MGRVGPDRGPFAKTIVAGGGEPNSGRIVLMPGKNYHHLDDRKLAGEQVVDVTDDIDLGPLVFETLQRAG